MKNIPMHVLKTITTETVSDVTNAVSNFLKQQILFTVDLEKLHYDIEDAILLNYFKHIPMQFGFERGPNEIKLISDASYQNDLNRYAMITSIKGAYIDFIKYKSSIIILKINNEKTKDRDGYNGNKFIRVMSLSCISTKTDKKNLMMFINKLIKKTAYIRKQRSGKQIWLVEGPQAHNIVLPKRSFNDVFIPNDQQYYLLTSINNFINQRKWYNEHHIPYHFGILLHGVGGTGKTSIIEAICNQFDSEIYMLSDIYDDISRSEQWLSPFDDKLKIIIAEDVDTMDSTNRRHWSNEQNDVNDPSLPKLIVKRKLGLLLNFMDGMTSPQNVIYIFTTNHVDDLDPALIRPGRIDLNMKIDYVCDETLDKFLHFHYNKGLPKNKHVLPNVTFSTLQTYVMQHTSFDEFINEFTI